jgi:hypothetical protein
LVLTDRDSIPKADTIGVALLSRKLEIFASFCSILKNTTMAEEASSMPVLAIGISTGGVCRT